MAMGFGGGMGGGAMGGQMRGAFGGAGGQGGEGLGFAGIPSELQDRVDLLVAHEPPNERVEIEFSHHDYDREPFTFRRFLGPYKVALLGVLVLVLVEVAALQSGPVLTKIVIDDGIKGGSKTVLVVTGIVYFALVAVAWVAGWGRIVSTGRIGERLMYDLRLRLFMHLQRLSLDFYTEEKAGVIMTRMTSDPTSLQQLFNEGLVQLVVQGLTLVVVTVALFVLSPTLALVTVVVIVPAMTLATVWFRNRSALGYLIVRDRIADVLAHLQESLSGVRVVTSHNRAAHNNIEHRNIAGDYREANNFTARVNGYYGPFTDVISILGQAALIGVGGKMVLDGELTVGELAAFILFLTAFFAPIQQLVQLYNVYQQGQASMTKLRSLLLTDPSVPELSDPLPLPLIDGAITLEHVTFSYRPGAPVIHDVDLHIRAGETFALVGATGSGKSTIAKLVARFYDPEEGRVLVDGIDVRNVGIADLRRQLGVVPQEPFLFASTLGENIAFAKPHASTEEIVAACAAVGIEDLVERMSDGLDTPVHERGVSLSSGERQLLALARAFLAQPRVLILDEATSNLDLASEAKVEQALDVLLEGRTAIIIAHRLTTARKADRIGVMDNGRLVELGSHDELVALGGRYAGMYEAWERHSTGH
jgi:ATP-binding cassette subfamily B protein